MPDISTKFMGLDLKNPLIAGSSGLTSHIDSLLEIESMGVAAVVLKSLFEEDLQLLQKNTGNTAGGFPKTVEYLSAHTKANKVGEYLALIDEAKKRLSIPVVASINCVSSYEWTSFSRKIESAGADALELNMFILPSDPMRNSEDNEKVYFEILNDIRKQVKIPIAVKISPFFSGMTRMALKLSWTGINGLVLFNRFFQPDIDIDTLSTVSGKIFSTPDEISLPLRWSALLSDRVMCDIAASTGVHDHSGMIKLLLAGAKAVQAVSAFYTQGPAFAQQTLTGLSDWMEEKGYNTIKDFNGKLSLKKSDNPADYDRYQYFRTFHPED
ncbi:MAG: dihydroorotate dehydrogenase-like protein [Bacteroidales bacterium]